MSSLKELVKGLEELTDLLIEKRYQLEKEKDKNEENEENDKIHKIGGLLTRVLARQAQEILSAYDDEINTGDEQVNIIMSGFFSGWMTVLLNLTEENKNDHEKMHEFVKYMENAIENSPFIKCAQHFKN